MRVEYVDKLTVPELRRHYPELNDLDLIAPDILDDAGTLASIPDATYDFVIAAHIIEHLTDPIGALRHWCRVLRPQGLIYLVVPDKRFTFDRLRACTPLEHMLLDYLQPSADRDYEHYLDYAVWVHEKREMAAIEEARRLHDLRYSIHMHVFTPADATALLAWFAHNVRQIDVVEGPRQNPESDEFHLLVRAP
jgi:SAM-dependent methyltransferase